jgi:2-oxoglutarate ferredoxin oxidoreductase subunit gamma
MTAKTVRKIVITGEGGQGIQLLSHALAKAAFLEGLNVVYMPNYGVEQRGGVSIGYLQIGKGEIGFPKFKEADFCVVLCDRAVARTKEYLGGKTLYVYDSGQIHGSSLKDIPAEKLPIPATETATVKLEPRVSNMIIAGALLTEIPEISVKTFEKVIDELLADKYKKKPQLKNLNRKALEYGKRLAKEAYVMK